MGSTRNKILNEINQKVRDILPVRVIVSEIDIEGPEIVIYTRNLDEFVRNKYIVRKIAQVLKKRVVIRPDPSELMSPHKAEKLINEIIPEDGGVTNITFLDDVGEVIIEASSPSVVIGKKGERLNKIKKVIGWAPNIKRTPPIHSKTVMEIRAHLQNDKEGRKKFLRALGERIYREPRGEMKWVRATFLGGYKEVGRSSTLFSTNETKVLVDCGLNPGASNDDFSPYLAVPEILPIESLDAVIVTHAHLDHSGLIPLLYKYNYNGPVYCTPATRDLMALLQLDGLKVTLGEGRNTPYDSSNIRKMITHTIPLAYGETTDIAPQIRLTFHNAGHILGSSICHFHFGDGLHNVAVTGDVKYENTYLFNSSTKTFPRLETLIIESTYGGKKDFQPSRKQASNRLKEILERTINRGGKALIPVFAVGRSQEVMITLEELMRTGRVPTVPIYVDGMILEATAIHTAYPDFLNDNLKRKIFRKTDNPFLAEVFKHVATRDQREKILIDPDPCVVLATSGMMTGGPVLEYLKSWGPNQKNALVFVGYQASGTIGMAIQRGQKEVTIHQKDEKYNIEINLGIEIVDGFSGHSDRGQLLSYVATMKPKPERIIIGHGEPSKSKELATSITKKYGIKTIVPNNLDTVRLV